MRGLKRGRQSGGLGGLLLLQGGEALQLPLRFHISRGIGVNHDLGGVSRVNPGVVQMFAEVESGRMLINSRRLNFWARTT